MNAPSRFPVGDTASTLPEPLFRQVAEQWPAPMLLLDRSLCVTWANACARAWLEDGGLALDGRAWAELRLPWSLGARRLNAVLAGAVERLDAAWVPLVREAPRHCQAQLAPLRDAAGHAVGVLCALHEVPEPRPAPPVPGDAHAVLASAHVGAFAWDLVSGEGTVDPAWCASMEIDPCAGPGHLARWEQEIHPDDVAEFRRRVAELEVGHGARFEAEYRVFTASARWVWLLQRGQATRAPDGRIAGVTGLCIDIDERKRAEIALQQSESQLATALWGAQAALWQWHVPTDTATMSPLWFAMTGYTREQWESIDDPWLSRLHPEDAAGLQRAFADHLENRSPSIEYTYRIRTAAGDWKWMLVRGRTVEWDFDGRATRAIGVSLDVDAQKRAELEFARQRESFEVALTNARAGMYDYDLRTGRVVHTEHHYHILGLDPRDDDGTSAFYLRRLHPEDRARADAVAEAARSGATEHFEVEYRVRHADGSWRWVMDRSRVVERGPDGRATRMVGVIIDVTDRVRTLEELRRSEARYRTVESLAAGFLFEIRFAGPETVEHLWVSDGVRDLLGAPAEEIVREGRADDFIDPDFLPLVHERRAAVRRGERRTDVLRVRTAAGEWRWVQSQIAPLRDPVTGEVTGAIGSVNDVTQRRLAEQALRQSEATLRAVTENSPDWQFLVDESLRLRFANRGFAQRTSASVIGCPVLDFTPEAEHEALVAMYRRIFATGRPERYEIRWTRPSDGAVRWLEQRASAVPTIGGERFLAVTVSDVTEARERRDLLLRQAKLLETMREGVVLLDRGGYMRFTNPALDQMFGYGPGELVGRHMQPLFAISEPQREIVMRDLQEQGIAGVARPVEAECLRRDGTRFVASFVTTSLMLGGEEHWLAVASDVTERVRLERTIIEIASREQQRIGSDLHDGLGQELTGIALMLRGMAARVRNRQLPEPADVEEIIALVNGAIESTRALARGLSPVSTVRGGLTGALRALAGRIGERGPLRVEVVAPPDGEIRLDESGATHLYRIAQEALTNVMRHAGAQRARIELRLLPGDDLQLSIADDGRGLPAGADAADQDGARGSADAGGGLGLGIMRHRARMLGGDLQVVAGAEGGCVVRCVCPNGPRPDATEPFP